MIKLNLTHEFTGRGIRDAAAPDVTYKANVHWTFEGRDKALAFIKDGWRDVTLALESLNELLISVTYDGVVYPVTLDWLKEYKASIEEQNPEMSDWYMCQLARDIINYQWNYHDNRLKNSRRPSPQSANGDGQKKEKLAAKS